MTEAEWRACADPLAMLKFLLRTAPGRDRKFRLFACACCRRIWDRFPDPRNRALVVAVEDHPDGKFEDPEIHGPGVASSAAEHEFGDQPAYWVAKYLGRGFYKMSAASSAVIVAVKVLFLTDRARGREVELQLAMQSYGADENTDPLRLPGELPAATVTEAAMLADLLRDVFGTPPRPAEFDSEWCTDTAVSLARGMYEARDFGAMPILADALQDAGCDCAEVLGHCRAPGPHVRGCWVVDLVLDKG